MFVELFEELLPTLPATPAQRERVLRAQQEFASWECHDASGDYKEPSVHVKTATGFYIVFPNHCSCPDWTHRGPVTGNSEIEMCKHQIGCYLNALFVEPAATAPSYTPGECPVPPVWNEVPFGLEEWEAEQGECECDPAAEDRALGITGDEAYAGRIRRARRDRELLWAGVE